MMIFGVILFIVAVAVVFGRLGIKVIAGLFLVGLAGLGVAILIGGFYESYQDRRAEAWYQARDQQTAAQQQPRQVEQTHPPDWPAIVARMLDAK